jgi:hypothetical protein
MLASCPQLLQSPGKNPQAPLNRKMDGVQSWSGHCAEKKNFLFLPKIEPQFLDCSACSLIVISN